MSPAQVFAVVGGGAVEAIETTYFQQIEFPKKCSNTCFPRIPNVVANIPPSKSSEVIFWSV